MKLILSNDSKLYSVFLDDTKDQEIKNLRFEPDTLNPPGPKGTGFFAHLGPQIVGSCNGVLCLNFPQCGVLWNPWTKTHHLMPEPELAEDDSEAEGRKKWRSYVVQGLGYDEINDDFKVIRVYQFLGVGNCVGKFDSKVLVYSLKSGSWKRVGDFPYFVHFGKMSDVFVNGALHFEVSSKKKSVEGEDVVESDRMIAALDVCNCTYKVVTRLPCGEKKYVVKLGVLGDCLCVIRNYDFGVSQCMVMKEYGVVSSWTELFRVKMDVGSRVTLRPISYLGDEKHVLLEAEGEIVCFDVGSKSFKHFEIDGVDEDFEVCVCMESEVVLGSVDSNDKMQQVNEENLESEVVSGSIDGDIKMQQLNEENLESEVVLGSVDGDDKMQEVNEENLKSEAVLGSVDGDDKMQQVKEENLEQQVNEENVESEVVTGSVDESDCGKMQQKVNEENLERVSTGRDLGAT